MTMKRGTTIQNSAKLEISRTRITNDQIRNRVGRRTFLSLVQLRRMLRSAESSTIQQMRRPARSITVQEIKAGWRTGFLKTT